MKKKILLIFICLFMISLNFKNGQIEAEEEIQYTPEEAFKIASSDDGNYIYRYDVGIGGTDVVIPPTINGLNVDRIGNQGAFQNKGLTNVVLPNTLKKIGNGAFSNNKITSIKIPDSVISIGDNAFVNNQLTSLELPDSVTELGSACFSNNRISELKLSNNLTAISNTCFKGNKLQSVVIPEGVETIGTNAFSENLSLNKVVIANSVKTIGDEAFRQAKISDLTLGNSITNIGNLAFSAGLNLQTIQLPETLEKIGYSAFSGGILSGTLIIPDSVTSIGYSAFSSNQIENIQFGTGLEEIEDTTFSNNCLSTLLIPNNITIISANAFANQSVYVTMNKYNGKYNFNFLDLLGNINIKNLANVKLSENYNGFDGIYNEKDQIVSYSKIPNKTGMPFLGYDYKLNDISNLTVKLYFKDATYQVTFKDVDGQIIESRPYRQGETPAEPNLENVQIPEDKQFSRWDNEISEVNDEVVYQMVLETKKLNVVFKDDQGNVIQTAPVEYGKDAIPPTNVFKEGYTFIGWDKSFSNVTKDLEVKAVYKINTYKVKFLDYDKKVIQEEIVNYGGTATAPSNPKREGYTFIGWDKEFSNIKEETIVTATYKINTYKVNFLDYDKKVIQEETVNYGEAATAPSDPKREGHTFIGWDKSFSNVTKDLEVKAVYKSLPEAVTKECIIKIGEDIDPLDYIEGINADGKTIKDIKIDKNNLNNNVPGNYEIEFTITDEWNGQTKGVLHVVVKEEIVDPDIKDEIKTEKIESPKDKIIETKDQSGLMFYSLIFILSLSVLVFEMKKKNIR